MNIKTKIVAALTLAVFLVPGISMAQTMSVAQLRAEIQSLTAQLTQLETQLAASSITPISTSTTTPSTPPITIYSAGCTSFSGYSSTNGESCVPATKTPPIPPIVVNPIVPTSSSPIVACPMYVPYCPYGGHSVVESNGCTQEVCNQKPTPPTTTPTPVITDVTSAGATPTPGSNEFLIGTNLPTQNASIVIDAGLASSQTITPTGYNAGGGGNMTFFLPSNVSVGSHTIEVQANGATSNQFTFSVVSVSPVAEVVPYISQVSPTTAPPDATVTVSGQNFDANSYVSLGNVPTGPENVPVAVTSQTTTSLTFTVPSLLVGAQPLYVAEHNSSLVSNKATLIVSTSSPIVACPMYVPYCPYGGHSVVESNGCTEMDCNPTSTQPTPCHAPNLCLPALPIRLQTSTSDTSAQTAIILQSLQSLLNQLSTLLKSL